MRRNGTHFMPPGSNPWVACNRERADSDRNRDWNRDRPCWGATARGRHESGVPLEVDQESLEELKSAPGADLADFERQRVKPWTVFDFSAGADLFRDERVSVAAQFDIQNAANRRFAYNFGNPFEGTHFGYPRLWSGRIKLTFH